MIIITIIYKKTTSSQMLTVFTVILLADTAQCISWFQGMGFRYASGAPRRDNRLRNVCLLGNPLHEVLDGEVGKKN